MADQNELSEDVLRSVSVEVRICVGTARPLISELLTLAEDTVLSLDKAVDDPVELYVGERLIGRGYLEETPDDPGGQLSVRLSSVGDPSTATE